MLSHVKVITQNKNLVSFDLLAVYLWNIFLSRSIILIASFESLFKKCIIFFIHIALFFFQKCFATPLFLLFNAAVVGCVNKDEYKELGGKFNYVI